MENKLSNLRRKLNQSALRDITFTEEMKRSVRSSINSIGIPPNRVRPKWRNQFNFVLSSIIGAALLMAIGIYTGKETGFISKSPNGQLSLQSKPGDGGGSKGTAESELSKEEVHYLLLNSMDQFKTAQGTFEIFSAASDSEMKKVDYAIEIGNKTKSLVVIKDSDKNIVSQTFYDGKFLYQADGKNQIYNKSKAPFQYKKQAKSVKDHYKKDENGIPSYEYRERPPVGIAGATLFPFELSLNYLEDYGDWEIESQDQSFLGRPTIILKGNLHPSAAEKHQASHFRFWVDSETGVLLRYETYHASGEIVDYLRTTSFTVNKTIPEETFKVDMAENKTEDSPNHSQSGEEETVIGAKGRPEEINKAIAQIQEKMPYFKQLDHPGLQLIYARLSKAENDYIATLYYKVNSDSHTDQIIFVREYQKGTIPPENGDFSVIESKKQPAFKLNEFTWIPYTYQINEYSRTVVQTEFDGNVYEISGQNVKLDELKHYLDTFSQNPS